jgi:hypothetical protein
MTTPRRTFTGLVIACLFLFGCAAMFVASYDEKTDGLLTDLTVLTQTTVTTADSGQLSADERQKFYNEAIGMVRTMKNRSALYSKNQQEIDALSELEHRYEDLRQHGASPRTSLTTGLRATLLDLQQIQVAKKRSAAFSAGLNKNQSTQ